MSDLNDWRLVYPGRVLEFGTLRTGYPLTSQVDIGAPTERLNDDDHPNADGIVFGVDSVGGRTLTFEVAVPKVGSYRAWVPNLAAQRDFAAAWAARSVRRVAGAVCELYNDDRGVLVYGRPRGFKPKLDKARQGWSELVCNFATTDDLFYGALEQAIELSVVPASVGGLLPPLVAPLASAVTTQRQQVVSNGGTEDTWPVVEFHGPSNSPQVRMLDAFGGVAWQLKVAGVLAYDEVLTVDTRPWVRRASVNGRPAYGSVTGSQLNDCRIPPGLSEVIYEAIDVTGTSSVTIKWRDAYGSL